MYKKVVENVKPQNCREFEIGRGVKAGAAEAELRRLLVAKLNPEHLNTCIYSYVFSNIKQYFTERENGANQGFYLRKGLQLRHAKFRIRNIFFVSKLGSGNQVLPLFVVFLLLCYFLLIPVCVLLLYNDCVDKIAAALNGPFSKARTKSQGCHY